MSQLWVFIVVGFAAGGAYALTAIGVVTVYRGSGVLNFAHGGIGMVGTFAFWEVYGNTLATRNDSPMAHWGLAPSLVVGVLLGAAVGLLVYAVVMYPLRNASELARVIASLGVLLVLQNVALLNYQADPVIIGRFMGQDSFDFLGAPLKVDTAVVCVLCIVLPIALNLLFRLTRLGLSATALRAKPVAASTLGISPHPTGIITWALGGALAAAGGILALPVIGLSPTRLTLLINYAFAASLLGKFRSYTVAVVAAFAMGIAESIMVLYDVASWIRLSTPFVVILAALVAGGTAVPGRGFAESRMPRVGSGLLKPIPIAIVAGISTFLLLGLNSGWATTMVNASIAALVSLSIVIVTGYAGQISLAPFAIVGVATLLVAHTVGDWNLGYELGLPVALLSGAGIGFLIGLPAVRVRGLDLTVVTLGFGIVVSDAVLTYVPFLGGAVGTQGFSGLPVPQPQLFGADFDSATQPYRFGVLCVVTAALLAFGVANLRRSRAGRRLLSARANERGAAALGISVGGAKIAAFTLGGAIAGVAGWLTVFRTRIITFDNFDVFRSIFALAFTIVGGVGYVAGALYTGFITAGGPAVYVFTNVFNVSSKFDQWLTIFSGVLVIQIMLQSPDGIIALVSHQRQDIKRLIRKMRGRQAPPVSPPAVMTDAEREARRLTVARVADTGTVQLRLDGLTIDYGNVRAVDSVSLQVTSGRILGVIGPNGAGKTSLIDAVTGFTRLARGSVELAGEDATRWTIRRRARAGLGRTFQNLELFDNLTVRENLLAASDRRDLVAFLTGWVNPGSRELQGAAAEAASLLDLHAILDVRISDLPQGTQRLVAIARALAAQPKVVCLDEPAAGLGEQERDNMSAAIKSLVDLLGIGVLIVEHNIDVVSGLCDDIVVLDFGKVIASGAPDEVLGSEIVRAAYLGTSGGHGIAETASAGRTTDEVPA